MILGKSELRKAIFRKELQFLDDDGLILPEWFEVSMGQLGQDPVALQPASVDLTLGDHWLVPKANAREDTHPLPQGTARPTVSGPADALWFYTDTARPVEYEEFSARAFWLPAHGFVLARTREVVKLSEQLTAFVEGRSSVGRIGLFVENAGWVDPGFQGSVTLELHNALPVPLLVRSGMRACQLVVVRVSGDTEGGYVSSKYHGQIKATGSRLHMDFSR